MHITPYCCLGVGEVGEKAVGAQVALVDEKQVTPADVGNNFFLYKEDIGKTRAAVSVCISVLT